MVSGRCLTPGGKSTDRKPCRATENYSLGKLSGTGFRPPGNHSKVACVLAQESPLGVCLSRQELKGATSKKTQPQTESEMSRPASATSFSFRALNSLPPLPRALHGSLGVVSTCLALHSAAARSPVVGIPQRQIAFGNPIELYHQTFQIH